MQAGTRKQGRRRERELCWFHFARSRNLSLKSQSRTLGVPVHVMLAQREGEGDEDRMCRYQARPARPDKLRFDERDKSGPRK